MKEKFDLEKRTLQFSKNIIELIKSIPFSIIDRRLCDQLIRSSTSIGANYREANETKTYKDFRNRIRITKKEAKETIYWLELLHYSTQKSEIKELINESKELIKIFYTIYMKVNKY